MRESQDEYRDERILYQSSSPEDMDAAVELRSQALKRVRRVVVKVGSAVLTTSNGLDLDAIERLCEEICWLKKRKYEIIVISSGAIAAGVRKIGLKKKPSTIPEKQAAAAAGQSILMQAYENAFGRHGEQTAQVLLTRDDLSHRRRFLNARNTLLTLLRWKVTPIINENDTVMVEEIKFGDNDNLAAMITSLIQADLFINLTNIEGLYESDPRQDPRSRLLDVVPLVDRRVERMADKKPGTDGRGGMHSKVQAAKKAAIAGAPTVIANGRRENILREILSGADIGTLFLPQTQTMASRKYWLAFTTHPSGSLHLDEGAVRAIVEQGKSLLAKGVRSVEGQFGAGSPVNCVDVNGKSVAIGLANYSSTDLKRIAGAASDEIERILGYKFYDEIIHRDNMVTLDKRFFEEGGED